MDPTEAERRALDLFEQLLEHPGNARFRARLLKSEAPEVLERLARLEAGHLDRSLLPTDMPDLTPDPARNLPDRIGPYRLVERIGQGGMGEVWRGERDDGRFEQMVAVKFLQLAQDQRALAAFDSERRILARLDHPDIVRLRDGGETEGAQPYLIMDYVDGAPIDAVAAPMPLNARIDLFHHAARIVQFAHGRLVAHGDIKPSNIMVDTDGRVRLLDFGISSLLHSEGGIASPPGAMTRDYSSPQRISGAPPSVLDDVFALGRLLHALAAAELDDDLAAIRDKATADEEGERYDSVSALIADVENWRSGMPVAARNGGMAYRARKFVARNRLGVALSAAAIVALGFTAAYATWNASRAEIARAEATARYSDAHGIASYLMFDLMGRMANQPHSLALRADMANKAQAYLDRLSNVANASAGARLDTARGFWQLAAFQSKSAHPNLGQSTEAKANLERAMSMMRGLSGPQVDSLRAHVLLDRVSLAANADNDLDLADQLLARAKPLVDRSKALDPALAKIYFHQLANLRSWQGRYDEERAAARSGLALPALSDPLQDYDLHDALLDILGDSYLNTGGHTEALEIYTQQVSLGVAAHARWPQDRMVISRLMYARLNRGVILNAMERLPEALRILEQASREAREHFAFEPADRWTEAQLTSIESARAQTLSFMGRYDEAIALMRDISERKRVAWEKEQREMRLFRAYVQVRALIGETQARNHRTAAQCVTDRDTLALYARMRSLGTLTQWDEDINYKEMNRRFTKNCR